jgi:alginate O-acetyltransferase complex protein AlgI
MTGGVRPMLFNSYVFIGAFLPVALAGYLLLARLGADRPARIWLTAASLFFYTWWNLAHLPVLLASIGFNYLMGRALANRRRRARPVRPLLHAGVAANLALLGYFKYTAFVTDNVGALAGIDFAVAAVVLPLAISFFTFQQIAYLADAAAGDAGEYGLVDYCLFVAFFPQLIAGPIVHHREMMGQFQEPARLRLGHEAFARGITFFTIGLFKKVVIADTLAATADAAFFASAEGSALTAAAAWNGVAAYTLQLYFDFSGYSDMAVGLALMFGIRLPYNFDSPYKAANIVDFWRRWHMTLSRFLRDYLYVALGGNRRGRARRHLNLMLTMMLGGLWHGAGWTFLAWGTLHGLYLVANHAWRGLRARLGLTRPLGLPGLWAARLVTLLAVMVGWVFFRAPGLDAAFAMLDAMAGAHGWIAGDDPLIRLLAPLPGEGLARSLLNRFDAAYGHLLVMAAMLAAWAFPNSQEIVDGIGAQTGPSAFRWRPSPAWAACIAACLLFTVTQMSRVSAFLYFQF